MLERDVLITNESYSEAGGLEKYPNMVFVSPVAAVLSDEDITSNVVNQMVLNGELRSRASCLDAGYVFNTKYFICTDQERKIRIIYAAIGTAYKDSKKL